MTPSARMFFLLFLLFCIPVTVSCNEEDSHTLSSQYDLSLYLKLGGTPVGIEGFYEGLGARLRVDHIGIDLSVSRSGLFDYVDSYKGCLLYYPCPDATFRFYGGMGMGYLHYIEVFWFEKNKVSNSLSTELVSGVQLNYWRWFRPFLQGEISIPVIDLKKTKSTPVSVSIVLGLGF